MFFMLCRHCSSHIVSSLVCTCLYICDFEGKWRIFIILFNSFCLMMIKMSWHHPGPAVCSNIPVIAVILISHNQSTNQSPVLCHVTCNWPIREQYCVMWPATDQSETSIQLTVMLQSNYLSSLISCRLCHCLTRVNIRYGQWSYI